MGFWDDNLLPSVRGTEILRLGGKKISLCHLRPDNKQIYLLSNEDAGFSREREREAVGILLNFTFMFKSEACRINALVNLPLSHTKQLFLNSTHQFVLILKAPAVKDMKIFKVN